jgi:hypothetical protein
MLQNAQYSVWFRTPEGEGYGVISLLYGDVSGGDTISSYTGTYVQDGDKFAATIAVTCGKPLISDPCCKSSGARLMEGDAPRASAPP